MTPFGFGPDEPTDENSSNKPGDQSRDKSGDNSHDKSNDGSGSHQNPNSGGFDFAAMMEQVQRQLNEQFQRMGVNPVGFVNPFAHMTSGDALPIAAIRDNARRVVGSHGSRPIGNVDIDTTSKAFELADLWLNEATLFPVTSAGKATFACARQDWVDASMVGWHATFEPVAQGLANALSRLLDEAGATEGGQSAIPMQALAGALKGMIGNAIATQLGQSIGGLAAAIAGGHDVGLPLLNPVRPVLIPENINAWGAELEVRSSEVFLFHALREGAIARLFDHNPWLVSYIRSAVVEYARGIHIDLEAIQRQAQEAMEEAMNSGEFDPTKAHEFTIHLNNGIFTPEETPQQRAALEKLEIVLALIDGWAEEVVRTAAEHRLPSLPQLIETLRRKRASANPAQQLFASLLGLEVSPRLTREASAFFTTIRQERGVDVRDRIWSGILPTADDLQSPLEFVKLTEIPDDLSGLDS